MTSLLITGAAGTLGSHLRRELAGRFDMLKLSDLADLGAAGPGEEIVPCDLGDLDAATRLVRDVDGIVHLAGTPVEGPFETVFHANMRLAYHIFEASRRAGGIRILYASSNHAIGFHRADTRIGVDEPHRPDSIYGLSKCFGEDLARYYYDKFGVESVSVRIGSCFPEPLDRRMLVTWISPRDLAGLVECVFSAMKVGATVIYGVSDNRGVWWDNSAADFLGWRPIDSSERFREKIEAATPEPEPDDPAVIFQGGSFAARGHFED